MKRILFLLAASAVMLAVGCTKKNLPSVSLSTDKNEVVINSYSASVAFTLSWELNGGNADITQTYVQFCNDKEFVSPYVLRSSGTSFVVTYKDLKKIQDNFGIITDYELIARLLVEGNDVPSVYSNKVRINVDIK